MARIIEITDIDSPETAAFTRLTGNQLKNRLDPEEGIFIVESPIAIDAALDSGCEPVALLTEKKFVEGRMKDIIDRVGNVPVYCAEHEVLSRMTGYSLTRGALCAMKRPPERNWRETVKNAERIAVLEDLVDTTNIGAIFRSAAGLGIDAVLLSPGCCDPLCRRSVRVSMGTVLKIPFARVEGWPDRAIPELKQDGFTVVSMALDNDTADIRDERIKRAPRIALVLGTEGTGLNSQTVALSDLTVKIPMSGGVDSLNVGACAAIAFFEISRKI